MKLAEEDEEKNKKNQVLVTLDKAYKSGVKKVEHLMEKHMDVSTRIVVGSMFVSSDLIFFLQIFFFFMSMLSDLWSSVSVTFEVLPHLAGQLKNICKILFNCLY